MPQLCKTLIKRAVDQNCLPPLQGGSFLARSPGLKPQAESCSPFGTKTSVIPVRKIEATPECNSYNAQYSSTPPLHHSITPRGRIRGRSASDRALVFSGTLPR
jgi:hypothetical protein